MHVAAGIGFSAKVAELQWWAVAKVASIAGVAPEALKRSKFDAASGALRAGVRPVCSCPS